MKSKADLFITIFCLIALIFYIPYMYFNHYSMKNIYSGIVIVLCFLMIGIKEYKKSKCT